MHTRAERLWSADVEEEQTADHVSIVLRRQTLELLLACCVVQLQTNVGLVVPVERLDVDIATDLTIIRE